MVTHSSISKKDLEDLPTPIAQVGFRFLKQTNARERYEAFRIFGEANLKYAVIVTIPIIKHLKESEGVKAELEVAKNSNWNSGIEILCKSSKEVKSAHDWVRLFYEWSKEKLDSKIQENIASVEKIVGISSSPPTSNLEAITHLTNIRNKTYHGALGPEAIDQINQFLDPIVEHQVFNSPWFHPDVCFKQVSAFSETYRAIRGLSPLTTKDLTEKDKVTWTIPPNRPSYVIYEELGDAFSLPPFIDYSDDKTQILFINEKINNKKQTEFIDYQSGDIKEIKIQGYLEGPKIPRKKLVTSAVPIVEEQDKQESLLGYQAIRPNWMNDPNIPQANWENLPLDHSSKIRLPAKTTPGIYALVAEVCTGGLSPHQIILYVGKTEDINSRFANYLNERDNEDTGRGKLIFSLNSFPNIRFYYTVVPDQSDRTNLERWLIKAIDPPANTVDRLKFSTETNHAWTP